MIGCHVLYHRPTITSPLRKEAWLDTQWGRSWKVGNERSRASRMLLYLLLLNHERHSDCWIMVDQLLQIISSRPQDIASDYFIVHFLASDSKYSVRVRGQLP